MAQVDYYLKIDGIPGESTDDKHKNEIDIVSWSWGQTNSGSFGSGGGGGSGKVVMQDFNFQMRANKASPTLFLKAATGEHIAQATLTCRKSGKTPVEYLKIKFTKFLISSYSTGGSAGSDVLPVEQVSLNFSRIDLTYTPQKADGSAGSAETHWYDVTLNKGA